MAEHEPSISELAQAVRLALAMREQQRRYDALSTDDASKRTALSEACRLEREFDWLTREWLP